MIRLISSSIVSSIRVFEVRCTIMPAKAVFVGELLHCIQGGGDTFALVGGGAVTEETVMLEAGNCCVAESIVKVLMI